MMGANQEICTAGAAGLLCRQPLHGSLKLSQPLLCCRQRCSLALQLLLCGGLPLLHRRQLPSQRLQLLLQRLLAGSTLLLRWGWLGVLLPDCIQLLAGCC